MSYLGILGLEFWKATVIFQISTLEFVKLQNFVKKSKCLNWRPKNPYLGIFGLEFLKTMVIFEISTFKFVKLQNVMKKWRCGSGSGFSLKSMPFEEGSNKNTLKLNCSIKRDKTSSCKQQSHKDIFVCKKDKCIASLFLDNNILIFDFPNKRKFVCFFKFSLVKD